VHEVSPGVKLGGRWKRTTATLSEWNLPWLARLEMSSAFLNPLHRQAMLRTVGVNDKAGGRGQIASVILSKSS